MERKGTAVIEEQGIEKSQVQSLLVQFLDLIPNTITICWIWVDF